MSNDPEIIFEFDHVHYSRSHKVIFDDISLTIRRNKITAVMGPSGSGKTTLLRLMTGMIKASQGQIKFKGNNLTEFGNSKLLKMRAEMSMLFQSGALFTGLTVYDNVAFPLREHTDFSEDTIQDLVIMKLHAVGLRGAKSLYPRELSGGMARRVALARALALDPNIILYDEPFTGQDPISMGVLLRLIKRLNQALSMTSVVVSHDVTETMQIADYVYIIANGAVLAEGAPNDLLANKSGYVEQFVQGLPEGPVAFHYPALDYYDELMRVNKCKG